MEFRGGVVGVDFLLICGIDFFHFALPSSSSGAIHGCGSGGDLSVLLPPCLLVADRRLQIMRGGAVGVIVDSENVAFGRNIDNYTFCVFLLRGLLSLLHKWQTSAKATFEKPFKHLTATAMVSSELVTFTTLILR
jgi:hypothetical protein